MGYCDITAQQDYRKAGRTKLCFSSDLASTAIFLFFP